MDFKTLKEQESIILRKFSEIHLKHNLDTIKESWDNNPQEDDEDGGVTMHADYYGEEMRRNIAGAKDGDAKVDPAAIHLERALSYVRVPEYSTVLPGYMGMYLSKIAMKALIHRFSEIIQSGPNKELKLEEMETIKAVTDFLFKQGRVSPLSLNASIIGIVSLAKEVPHFLNLVHLDGVLSKMVSMYETLGLPCPTDSPTNRATWAVVQREDQPLGCFTFVLVMPYGAITIQSNIPVDTLNNEPLASTKVCRIPYGAAMSSEGDHRESAHALAAMLSSMYDAYLDDRTKSGELEIRAWLTDDELGELAESFKGSLPVIDDSGWISLVGAPLDQGFADIRALAYPGPGSTSMASYAEELVALQCDDRTDSPYTLDPETELLGNILYPNTAFDPIARTRSYKMALRRTVNELDCTLYPGNSTRTSPYSTLELILGSMSRHLLTEAPVSIAHTRATFSAGELILGEILYYYLSGRWVYEELLARNRDLVLKSQTPLRVKSRDTLVPKFPEYKELQDNGLDLGITYRLESQDKKPVLVTFIASCINTKLIKGEDDLEHTELYAYVVTDESVAAKLLGDLADIPNLLNNIAASELHTGVVSMVSVSDGLALVRQANKVTPATIQLGCRLLFVTGNLRITDIDHNSCLSGSLHIVSESDIMITKCTMLAKLDPEAIVLSDSSVLDDVTMDKFNAEAASAFETSHVLRRQVAEYARKSLQDLLAMRTKVSPQDFVRLALVSLIHYDLVGSITMFEPLALEPVVIEGGRFKTLTRGPLRTKRLADIAKEASELGMMTEEQAINYLKTIIRVNVLTPIDTPSLKEADPTLPYDIAFTKRLGGVANYTGVIQSIAKVLTCLSKEIALRTASKSIEELAVPFKVNKELANLSFGVVRREGRLGYIRRGDILATSKVFGDDEEGEEELDGRRIILGLGLRGGVRQ